MPFINKSCDNTKIIQINEFDKTAMTWETNVFFPEKFKEPNGCVLRVGIYENYPGPIIKKTTNVSERFSGIYVDVVNLLRNELNLTPNIREYEPVMSVIYKNKTGWASQKSV